MRNNIKMISVFLALSIASFSFAEDAKTIKVAVIDTGFDFQSNWKKLDGRIRDGQQIVAPTMCQSGHADFSGSKNINDDHGHGSHVSGIIARYAGKSNYCIVSLKAYSSLLRGTAESYVAAFKRAIELKVDIINISGGGTEFNQDEYGAVRQALDKGIIIVAAAGNGSSKIDHTITSVVKRTNPKTKKFLGWTAKSVDPISQTFLSTEIDKTGFSPSYTFYFPANYDSRIIVVGNVDKQPDPNNIGQSIVAFGMMTNYGNAIDVYEDGVNVISLWMDNQLEMATGTSQAAPVVTGNIIRSMNSK